MNPYQSPAINESSLQTSQFTWARIGFVTSLVGVAGVFIASFSVIGVWLAFLCVPGVLFSIVGLFCRPRRLAAWGVALGLFGSLYLPTLCLTFVFS